MRIDRRIKHFMAYLFFGICTTLVNMVSYGLFTRVCKWEIMAATAAAWVMAVLFAFITNKKYVFDSRSFSVEVLKKELPAFFGCRITTGIFDLAFMYIMVKQWELPDLWMKICSNGMVIVLNYMASRWFIFRKNE